MGAGLQVGPNATRILEGWNLDLLGGSVEPESIELRNAVSGSLLNTIPLRRAARVRYGAPYVTLMRADLQKALFTRAQELEIPIRFGAPVSRVHDAGEQVAFEAGGTSGAAAALIGADGVKSPVRELAGFNPRRYSAQSVAWRAMLPLAAMPAPLRSVIAVWMAPGAHLVHYPVDGGASVNAVLVISDIFQGDGADPSGRVLPYLLGQAGWLGRAAPLGYRLDGGLAALADVRHRKMVRRRRPHPVYRRCLCTQCSRTSARALSWPSRTAPRSLRV